MDIFTDKYMTGLGVYIEQARGVQGIKVTMIDDGGGVVATITDKDGDDDDDQEHNNDDEDHNDDDLGDDKDNDDSIINNYCINIKLIIINSGADHYEEDQIA